MEIELLYFEGCLTYLKALQNLREVLGEEGISGEVKIIMVGSEEEAEELKFLGSPTIRIDGIDIDKSALGRTDFGIKCRLYFIDGEFLGYPTKEMIRRALGLR